MARALLAHPDILSDAVAMSLRARLILSYAVLILLLGVAAWWGVQRLTADLTAALGETATRVGRSMVTVLRQSSSGAAQGADAAPVEHDTAPQNEAAAPRDPAHVIEVLRRDLLRLRSASPDGALAPAGHSQLRVLVDGQELTPDQIAARGLQHEVPRDIEIRAALEQGRPALRLSGAGFSRVIPLPQDGIERALERYRQQLGWGLLTLLLLALGLSVAIAHRIARPLRALADTAQRVAEGGLGAQAPDGGVPEVRSTIAAFNRMSLRLRELDAEAATLRADRELAELGEIGRGLAHSLRNPLHALGLSLEALAGRCGDGGEAQALARAGREQLRRVDQALRGFLALSASEGAGARQVAVQDVIDDVLLEASQRAQGRVALRRSGEQASLHAVPAELRVMLHALVINALEASPDDGVIDVGLRPTAEGGVVIDVFDDGDGVADAIRARLFQPHVSSKPHGAGMGLYLAERLARLRYRGTIALETRASGGTCARLRLMPREAPHDH